MQANPTVPIFQKEAPPGTPKPKLDLADMDKIHRLIRGDNLADIMTRIAHKGKI